MGQCHTKYVYSMVRNVVSMLNRCVREELDTPDVDTDFTPQVVNPDSVVEKNTIENASQMSIILIQHQNP